MGFFQKFRAKLLGDRRFEVLVFFRGDAAGAQF
jgi:hypothetical protein